MKIFTKIAKKIRVLTEKKTFGLDNLDLKLKPYVNFKNGFFVEVGANDGISQSNTLYLEKYNKWKGLLIEAIPTLAEKCKKNRPRCIVENCALVANDYPEETIEIRYCNLMSVVKGGMRNEEEELKHIQVGKQFLLGDEQSYTVNVPAKTLSTVLDKYHIKHIDLLSLDVEGYEAHVLRGIDFKHHCPEYILIEVRYKEDVEAVVHKYYKKIAILNVYKNASDILYRRKNSLDGSKNEVNVND